MELSKILGDGFSKSKIVKMYQQNSNEKNQESSQHLSLCKNTQISNI
jgi:hypothetical protein